jgi:hypothetical protein
MIKLLKTEYNNRQQVIDAMDEIEFLNRNNPYDSFEGSNDYLEYVGRKIKYNGKTYVGRNQEHAVLKCLYDAVKLGKTFRVFNDNTPEGIANVKGIIIYDEENKNQNFSLAWKA